MSALEVVEDPEEVRGARLKVEQLARRVSETESALKTLRADLARHRGLLTALERFHGVSSEGMPTKPRARKGAHDGAVLDTLADGAWTTQGAVGRAIGVSAQTMHGITQRLAQQGKLERDATGRIRLKPASPPASSTRTGAAA